MDPDANGAVQKQRRISLPLKDKFDEILDKWEQTDIKEDVGDEPTEWCSNVVLTPKKDGENREVKLDVYGKPKTANGKNVSLQLCIQWSGIICICNPGGALDISLDGEVRHGPSYPDPV